LLARCLPTAAKRGLSRRSLELSFFQADARHTFGALINLLNFREMKNFQVQISDEAYNALMLAAINQKTTVSALVASVMTDLAKPKPEQQAAPAKSLEEVTQAARAKALAAKITTAIRERRALSFG
jgi:hypothetical protein